MTYRSIMHPCEACKLNHEYYLLHSYHLFQWSFIDYFLVHYQNVSEIQHIKVTVEVYPALSSNIGIYQIICIFYVAVGTG